MINNLFSIFTFLISIFTIITEIYTKQIPVNFVEEYTLPIPESKELCNNITQNECIGRKAILNDLSTKEINEIEFNNLPDFLCGRILLKITKDIPYTFSFPNGKPLFIYINTEDSNSRFTLNDGFTENGCDEVTSKFDLLLGDNGVLTINAYKGTFNFYVDPNDNDVKEIQFQHQHFFNDVESTLICYNAYEVHTPISFKSDADSELTTITKNSVKFGYYNYMVGASTTLKTYDNLCNHFKSAIPNETIETTKWFTPQYAYSNFFSEYDWNASGKFSYIDISKKANQKHIQIGASITGFPYIDYENDLIPIFADTTYILADKIKNSKFHSSNSSLLHNVKILEYTSLDLDNPIKISIPAIMNVNLSIESGYYDESTKNTYGKPILSVECSRNENKGYDHNIIQLYIQANTIQYIPYFGDMVLNSNLQSYNYIYNLNNFVSGNIIINKKDQKYEEDDQPNGINYIIPKTGVAVTVPFQNNEFSIKTKDNKITFNPSIKENNTISGESIAILTLVCITLIVDVVVLILMLIKAKLNKNLKNNIRI